MLSIELRIIYSKCQAKCHCAGRSNYHYTFDQLYIGIIVLEMSI